MWAAARLKAITMENLPSAGLFCQSPPISASSCGCFSIPMGIYGGYILEGWSTGAFPPLLQSSQFGSPWFPLCFVFFMVGVLCSEFSIFDFRCFSYLQMLKDVYFRLAIVLPFPSASFLGGLFIE